MIFGAFCWTNSQAIFYTLIMRFESQVTSISWIPNATIPGLNKVVFDSGFTHYDEQPPLVIENIEILRDADVFRFANVLRASVDVEDGKIVSGEYHGGCVMGATTVSMKIAHATMDAVEFPVIQREVEITENSARFVQTVGGHTGLPAPRRTSRFPFFAFSAPTVWTTLGLTIFADGSSEFDLVGASAFPRHWIYNSDHEVTAKVGLADFRKWWRKSFGPHTPWKNNEHPAFVTEVETPVEMKLHHKIMNEMDKPRFRRYRKGKYLTIQGEPGDEVFLIIDGVVSVEHNGEKLGELGPGTVLGERASLEKGLRTSSLKALTNVKVAVVDPHKIEHSRRRDLQEIHNRENALIVDIREPDIERSKHHADI
jgi:hypothetical protein